MTQTTLSRDLCEIGLLTKVKKNDKWCIMYQLNETDKIDLVGVFVSSFEGVGKSRVQILVLHTKLGEAAVLANIVDANKDEWI